MLCADDYGQNSGVSQAILQLLAAGRLSATSCLVTFFDWKETAQALKPFLAQFYIGLHFNLTEGQPLSVELQRSHGFLSLPHLLLRANLRQLDRAAIQAELNAQIDAFQQAMGCLPDFIDGHQHVHQFPIVRDALFAVYENKLRHTNCYLRSTFERYRDCLLNGLGNFKRIILQLSGAQAFKRHLIRHQIPHNASFSGVYNFKQAMQYSHFFPIFLKNITDNGLILCHPGLSGLDQNDALKAVRAFEFNYLLSEQFVLDCEKYQVVLRRK